LKQAIRGRLQLGIRIAMQLESLFKIGQIKQRQQTQILPESRVVQLAQTHRVLH